jgi:hypothetical protein
MDELLALGWFPLLLLQGLVALVVLALVLIGGSLLATPGGHRGTAGGWHGRVWRRAPGVALILTGPVLLVVVQVAGVDVGAAVILVAIGLVSSLIERKKRRRRADAYPGTSTAAVDTASPVSHVAAQPAPGRSDAAAAPVPRPRRRPRRAARTAADALHESMSRRW